MIDHIFLAFADSNRRKMLELLNQGSKSAGELSSAFEISGSAVSQHLKVLLQAGLVGVEKRKTNRIYYLKKDGFNDLEQYLGQFWDDHLSVLKRLAEAEERKEERS
ncbi:ArsR/SmtB family transcription factor [Paenibacillaceae bacterium WGS1546]|uniref:ArsR/SmtB family transcription factor n=1 Tax=Cohnella sp. WGS1546 TaxID=3366810 RepID=UPI00372D55B6